MAYRRFARFIPPIIITIVVIIAVVGLVALGRFLFGGGAPVPVDTARENLLNTSVGHGVRMTVRGPIVANEEFHTYQITVTQNSRNLTTYQGYLDKPVTIVALGNNIPAYEEFVHALDDANMVKNRELQGDRNDIRGLCATGRVITYEVLKDNKTVKQLWTTSCNANNGSLGSNGRVLNNLFRAQIPDSRQVISNVNLQ